MRLSVIIPCYRSEGSIEGVVESLVAVLGVERDPSFEIVLVDDGSPDGVGDVIDSLDARHPEVHAIHLRRNYGQHNAIVAGLRTATGAITVTMDDDGQHRADQLPALIAPLIANPSVDLVYGVPTEEEHGFGRSLASRSVKWALVVVGVENARSVSAFRAFRTDLRDAFVTALEAEVNVDVVLSWSTTRVEAVPVVMDRRAIGRSNYSVGSLLRHAFGMVTGYTAVPLRVASWIGGIAALIGAVLLLTFLVQYSIGETTVAGFTSIMAAVCLFSGAQLLAIGLIGEYLGRQHFRAMHKPMYLIRPHDDSETK